MLKQILRDSVLSSAEIPEKICRETASLIIQEYYNCHSILVLCGNNDTGHIGLKLVNDLSSFQIKVDLLEGKEKSFSYEDIKSILVKKKDRKDVIKNADLIIDCVYGSDFHGKLKEDIRDIFRYINDLDKTVISLDINSGAEADTGCYDHDALHSDLTLAIGCYRPFHMLSKEHRLFEKVQVLDAGFKKASVSHWHEMNEDLFFKSFPHKPVNAYKGTYGKTLLVGGSYGMAGALSLNITGAKTVGASYINVALPDEVYGIVASHHITPVYHPFHRENMKDTLLPLIHDAKAIAFGSGSVNMDRKMDVMDMILQNSTVPVVLDAEALRLLDHNTYILNFVKEPVILTPHIGEFSAILNKPVEVVQDHKIEYASMFTRKYKVYVVLKGPDTIVAAPSGEMYINQSGCQALAQAGSGDLLTGIMAGTLTMVSDVFQAVCMAVWLHGYLAEIGTRTHSIQNFDLLSYPDIMDQLFKKHGF
ncbi:MAG: NAD(P)H-hydrate dehydratase [Erysipelotrichaceae bacterium]|nr:NAD(P)H-hydrate dehydratase [Erysipelotrichaceae bacterium]